MRPKLLFIAIMALLASCNSNEPIPIDADNAAGNDKYLVEIDEAIKIADSVLAQLDAQNGKTRASGRYLSSIEAFRADGGYDQSNDSFALNARFSEEGEKENPGLTSIHSGIYIYYDFKKKINL